MHPARGKGAHATTQPHAHGLLARQHGPFTTAWPLPTPYPPTPSHTPHTTHHTQRTQAPSTTNTNPKHPVQFGTNTHTMHTPRTLATYTTLHMPTPPTPRAVGHTHAPSTVLRDDRSPVGHQATDRVRVAPDRSEVQGRAAVPGPQVHGGTLGQQVPDDARVPRARGAV
jgi:hypothetical protein